MTDKKPEIPASIRALLEPFRNVTNSNGEDTPLPSPEKTFLDPFFRPTSEQLHAMGRVTSTWAVFEHVLEIALGRLAMAPAFSALALTNDLGVNNRMRALKTLIELHKERYAESVIALEVLSGLEEVSRKIPTLKDRRNKVAHLVWLRFNDKEMLGLRPRALTGSAATRNETPKLSLEEINETADLIQELSDTLFALAQMIPEVDEGPHVRSLSQRRHPPHSDT